MISLIYVCYFGVANAASLFRGGEFTPAPPGVRPSCASKGATFCEKVDKYPTKIIQRLLQSKSFFLDDYFIDESQGLVEPPEYILHEDMIQVPQKPSESIIRKSRAVEQIPSVGSELSKKCPILSKTTLPKLAANRAGEWKFVVQDEESETRQKVKVHICDQSEECRAHCIQFYAPVPMVAVDLNGEVKTDSFWLPSSCRCSSSIVNNL